MTLNYIGAFSFQMKPNNWKDEDTDDFETFLAMKDIDWIQEVFDDERDRIILYPEYEQPNELILTHIKKINDEFMKPRNVKLNGYLTWLSNNGEKAYRVFIEKDGDIVLKELDLLFI